MHRLCSLLSPTCLTQWHLRIHVPPVHIPHFLKPPSVNFMIFPLCTNVTDGKPCSKAYLHAARTRRSVPSLDTGFTPNEEDSGKRTLATPISSCKNDKTSQLPACLLPILYLHKYPPYFRGKYAYPPSEALSPEIPLR